MGFTVPEMLAFYKQQNINPLQLLPIAACMHEPHLQTWERTIGVTTIPVHGARPSLCRERCRDRTKDSSSRRQRNGIEVILDVVYNHTAEGGEVVHFSTQSDKPLLH